VVVRDAMPRRACLATLDPDQYRQRRPQSIWNRRLTGPVYG
jgi:hypothetical protein